MTSFHMLHDNRATAGAQKLILITIASVRCVPVLYGNGLTYCHSFFHRTVLLFFGKPKVNKLPKDFEKKIMKNVENGVDYYYYYYYTCIYNARKFSNDTESGDGSH